MSTPKTLRAPRPRNVHFPPVGLANDLKELAGKKNVPWDWSGLTYESLIRAGQPDLQGLKLHAPVLKIILRAARTGFPSHPNLRETWIILQKEHQIIPNLTEAKTFTEMMRAADRWRILCRHVYGLAKAGDTTKLDVEVAELVGLIELPTSDAAMADADEERHNEVGEEASVPRE